jgi:hypothetical protein
MSEASTDFNPFQAPVSGDDRKTELGEDDEFLISRREILCRDTVELPMVCIRYGQTEDLELRKKTLRTFSAMGAFTFVITVIAFLILVTAVTSGDLPFSSTAFGKLFYLVVFMLAVPATFWAFRRYGCNTVDASWYVGPRYRRMILWEKRIGRTIVVVVAVTGGIGIARASGSSIPLVGLFLLALLLGRFFDPNVSLQLVGRRRGAFVVRGHSKKFYHAVQRIGGGF